MFEGIFFEGELDGKGVVSWSGLLGFYITPFTSLLIFDLLFMCKLKDVVSIAIFSCFYFIFLKVFLIVFYFINCLFMKKVYEGGQIWFGWLIGGLIGGW